MVAGRDAATFGEAKNSWLTGTAAWTFVDVSQYILGIQPTLAGLKIDPCIPHEMDGFTLRRVWRGVTYEIVVENPDHLEKGVKTMTVDGKPVSGSILSRSRRLDRRGQGRHGLTVRLLPQSSSPQWAAAFSVRSLYTGVLLHEPENSPTLLRAQQNKGVFFVCSLSGMVIPRALLTCRTTA